MTDTQEKKVIVYVSHKQTELAIVFKKDQKIVIDGQIVKYPVEYIRFQPSVYGGRFETDDVKKQAKIESLPQFKRGEIVRMGDKANFKAAPATHPVKRGGVSTRPNAKPAVKAPVETPATPPAAAKGPVPEPEPEKEKPEPTPEPELETAGGSEQPKKMF